MRIRIKKSLKKIKRRQINKKRIREDYLFI